MKEEAAKAASSPERAPMPRELRALGTGLAVALAAAAAAAHALDGRPAAWLPAVIVAPAALAACGWLARRLDRSLAQMRDLAREHAAERQRLDTLLAALPAGVVQHDARGRIVDANPEACRLLGMPLAQLQGRAGAPPRWDAVDEDGRPLPGREHPPIRVLRSGRPVRAMTVGLLHADGRRRWLRVNAEPLRDAAGKIDGALSCFVDVTEQRAQRQLLQLSIDAAGLGTFHWHLPSGRFDASARCFEMLGYAPDAWPHAHEHWKALVHPDDLAPSLRALQRHLDGAAPRYEAELRLRRADGRWGWVMACGAVVERDAEGRALRLVGVRIDITRRKALERRLAESAWRDELTGLPNRVALLERLARCISRARADAGYRYAVLSVDLDHFKHVNDALGHAAGDALLRQVAERLRATLRETDALARLDARADIATRLGGDEFVVLLNPIDRAGDAQAVAQRLIDALAAPFSVAGQTVWIGASVGIVIGDAARQDAEAALRDADTAMYEAKRAGRGRHTMFAPEMRERLRRALDLEADLRRALSAPGELYLVYQPIVDLASGALHGVEALLRWNHPQRGPVAPDEFIPVAEERGLIGELGAFVLEAACREAATWPQVGGSLARATLAVNVSRAQLVPGTLRRRVRDVLRRTGMSPRRLRLEITESAAAQEHRAAATLMQLRALGVTLALDDFGTGYSSLAALDRLPIDAVKIDRAFVQHAADSAYRSALIEATLTVARALGIDVVAEGVETEAQAALLRRVGCPSAQGWYFGRPVEAAVLRAAWGARIVQDAEQT